LLFAAIVCATSLIQISDPCTEKEYLFHFIWKYAELGSSPSPPSIFASDLNVKIAVSLLTFRQLVAVYITRITDADSDVHVV
jgi:hypothetical protein